jgi:hypothetical protein
MRKPGFALLAAIALAAGLGACSRKAPLSPELQAIRCPVNRPAHASATFVNARITFVCIGPELADTPYLLKCDLTSHPMVCEEEGSLFFSRSPEGVVYAGPLPGEHKRDERDSLWGGSRLTVNFRKGPPRTATFEEEETDWKFLIPRVGTMLPSGFTLVKGTVCDRKATVLNTGVCNLEAKSASLYWHIAVAIHAEKGTPVYEEEYRAELERWLELLGKLVKDPAK